MARMARDAHIGHEPAAGRASRCSRASIIRDVPRKRPFPRVDGQGAAQFNIQRGRQPAVASVAGTERFYDDAIRRPCSQARQDRLLGILPSGARTGASKWPVSRRRSTSPTTEAASESTATNLYNEFLFINMNATCESRMHSRKPSPKFRAQSQGLPRLVSWIFTTSRSSPAIAGCCSFATRS
jgi:hypothetical protein